MLEDLGFTDGINEVIVITFKEDGSINTAPIGIVVDKKSVYARIYSSHTRENVERDGTLYANVILDPTIFVLSTFTDLDESYFESLDPPIIRGALSWCKFKAEVKGLIVNLHPVDGKVLRKSIRAYNRGFSALIEALILASRKEMFERSTFFNEMAKYKNTVMRCGGEKEREAFKILERFLSISF